MPPRPEPQDLAVQRWIDASLGSSYAHVLDEPVPPELSELIRTLLPEA